MVVSTSSVKETYIYKELNKRIPNFYYITVIILSLRLYKYYTLSYRYIYRIYIYIYISVLYKKVTKYSRKA